MESESQSPRRGRGRPSKGSAAKRASFNTRIREALKQQLEAAASEAGRSLSEEIEYRLEQSVEDQRHLFTSLKTIFGQDTAAIMLLIGLSMRETVRFLEPALRREKERPWPFRQRRRGSGAPSDEIEQLWKYLRFSLPPEKRRGITDPFIFDQAVKAINVALWALRPDGEPVQPPPPKGSDPELIESLMRVAGEAQARGICEAIIGGTNWDNDEIITIIRDWLGEAGIERLKASLR